MCIQDFCKQTCIYEGCGITWYHPTGFNEQRRTDHRSFYCPNGHPQCYLQKTELEALKEKIHKLERDKAWVEDERDRYHKCAEHKKRQINGLRGFIKRNRKEAP